MSNIIPIKNKIYTIRGKQVMLDSDLAMLYEVETKNLNKAIKRNIERFPQDFMFQLTKKEFKYLQSQIMNSNKQFSLRFQNGTSKSSKGGRTYLPYVFTEQGVASISGVLKSKRAVKVNISIMRAFVAMRRFIQQNATVFQKLTDVETKLLTHDEKFKEIFKAINKDEVKQGIFYEGQIFDSHKFTCDLINKAKKEIILIDNYIDENTLLLFSERKEKIKVIIYTKNISKKLLLSLEKFNSQYQPIIINKFDKSHDRFMIIDNKEIYHIGASLKDVGKKWFAFSKLEIENTKIMNKIRSSFGTLKMTKSTSKLMEEIDEGWD